MTEQEIEQETTEETTEETEPAAWKCETCGAEYKTKSGLWKHQKSKHGTEDETEPEKEEAKPGEPRPEVFLCDVCGKTLKTQKGYESHVKRCKKNAENKEKAKDAGWAFLGQFIQTDGKSKMAADDQFIVIFQKFLDKVMEKSAEQAYFKNCKEPTKEEFAEIWNDVTDIELVTLKTQWREQLAEIMNKYMIKIKTPVEFRIIVTTFQIYGDRLYTAVTADDDAGIVLKSMMKFFKKFSKKVA